MDYAETNASVSVARSGSLSRDPGIRPDMPLTSEVMDTLGQALDTANETRHRLWQLRDRLLGSPPESATQGNGSKFDPPHFKAAHRERADTLRSVLAEIDSISLELSNRL